MANAENAEKEEKKAKFTWNQRLDIILLREYAFQKPYQYKPGSENSCHSWNQVQENLRTFCNEFTGQTVKSLRDHLNLLLRKRETVVKALEKQSGIEVEETEIDTLMDNINMERKELIEFFAAKKEETKTSEEVEKKRANDTRLKAMETVGETKKRKIGEDDDPSPKRKERRTSNDTLAFLTQRAEERKKERQEELELRQRDLDARNQQSEATSLAMLEMMKVMQEQFKAEQQQAQRHLEMQQQQNEQNSILFAALIDKMKKD